MSHYAGMYRRTPQLKNRNYNGLYIALVVFVVGFGVISISRAHFKQRDIIATVCDKSNGYDSSSGSAKYRIYTASPTSHATFTVSDSIIGGYRTNSADFYGRLKPNTTYNMRVKGYRFGLTSTFPNILRADKTAIQHPEWCG